MQLLTVAGVILVPDHQVYRQALQPTVGVSLYELARQIYIRRIADLQQHDRQVAGNGVTPQTGLPTGIPEEDAGFGAKRGVRVDHRPGQPSIEFRVSLAGIDLPQHYLPMCPGQIENPIREAPVLVFFDKAEAGIAGLAYARNNIYGCRFSRIDRQPIPNRDNRVEHGALAAGERASQSRRRAHRLRIGYRIAPADEAHAVGFV